MPFDYSTANLISSIKIRAMMPTSQVTFTEERLLQLSDEEMQNTIFPMIMSTKGDYFLTNYDQTMTTEKRYPLPTDAVGLMIKDLYWIDPNDQQERQVEIPQVTLYQVTNEFAAGWVGMGFYIENNHIVLTPRTLPNYTLRQKYYRRASKLIPNDEAGQIESIDTNTLIVTLSDVPEHWIAGDELCAVNEDPPFNNTATGLEIQSIGANSVTLDSVDDLEVGNWLCLDGDSNIPQITVEAHPILAQSVACKCLEALGDPGLVTAQAKFEQIKKNFIDTMTPRVQAQAKKVVNRNGTLAWGLNSRWGWWGGR